MDPFLHLSLARRITSHCQGWSRGQLIVTKTPQVTEALSRVHLRVLHRSYLTAWRVKSMQESTNPRSHGSWQEWGQANKLPCTAEKCAIRHLDRLRCRVAQLNTEPFDGQGFGETCALFLSSGFTIIPADYLPEASRQHDEASPCACP